MPNPDRAAELLKIERFIANHGVRRGRPATPPAFSALCRQAKKNKNSPPSKSQKPPSRDEYRKWLSSSHRAQRQR
jgi:hypothetical protein